MTLTISCLREVNELEALAPSWDELDRRLTPRTPFTSPAWNLAWWKHLRAHNLFADDSLSVYALHDDAGGLVAVAPMLITSRPAKGPLRIRELRFFGADANITELRGIACTSTDYDRALAALLRLTTTNRHNWQLLTWSGLRHSQDEWRDAGYPPLVWRRQTSDFCLKMPANWEAFRGALPRNVRESIRKCTNSLRRDGHDAALRIVAGAEPARDALDTFFRLHRARANAPNTTVHADAFYGRHSRSFLREYVAHSATRGELRIFQLVIDGTVVATRIGFLLGRDLYLYYSGYDPAWARYSVMTTVLIEILKWSIQNGVDVVNLSTGEDESKTRWRPSVTVFHEAAQRSGTLAMRTGLAAGEKIYLGVRDSRRAARRWFRS
jgi:CelD/BcsL family acetyltransferase involved in cellulose biosynthesis